MLFNTIDFVVFLPIVVLLYYLFPAKLRWILLLAASYFFYMSWNPRYIYLILFSTIIDYLIGLKMESISVKKKRLPWLILSMLTNLGLLFSFKYLSFATENINLIASKFGFYQQIPLFDILLPVGISFYTFQTLSYAIDIYNAKIKAEHHLGYFALYVSFFPQLVAGPIERFNALTPQFKIKHHLTYVNLSNGIRLIVYGLFIKMVIADNLSPIVDKIFLDPSHYHSLDVLFGMIAYSFQIYSDFYGYSLIAIGSALLIGIKLMDNFRTPYLAKNIAEFWQRWHISLSTWFRDYVYYPLGGKRTKTSKWISNILIVFILSGIWHGTNWTFIIWGALYAIVYLIEKMINHFFNFNVEETKFSFWCFILPIKTFILVTLIWVFFRSQSIPEALVIFKSLFFNWEVHNLKLNVPWSTIIFLITFIISDLLFYNTRFDKWIVRKPFVFRWSIYFFLLFSIIVFAGIENFPFIYFQF